MDIKEKVEYLKKHHMTNDPFVIAQEKGILILYEELGEIKGYYNKILRQKQIHINRALPKREQVFTCAHELGHALIHPNANTPFLRQKTYLSINKMEIEANRFAVELLITDDDLHELLVEQQYTTDMAAKILGYKKELIDLRVENYIRR